jgi:uncharacterized protein YndB with AHSA1/START domain
MSDERPIVVEKVFAASRDRVWRAITDAKKMPQWFFESIREFRPEPGFTTKFTVTNEGRDYVHVWRVRESTPRERMTWDWTYEGVPGASVVVWELEETPQGTKLRLTHGGIHTFPESDPSFTRESCQGGWEHFLDRLKGFLENRIEKEVTLRAPVSRVWRALTDPREFAQWFGVKLQGEFAPGKTVLGTFDQRMNEAAIMSYQESVGLTPSKVKMPEKNAVFCTVERLEPERYFSFRWIPYGIDAEADPANEPTTLVEFFLEKIAEGTKLDIVESGFEHVPSHRRERAFRMNDGGWTAQAKNIRDYVESK